MNLNNKSYRADIQLLRGISVLLVVFYHLNISGFDNGYLGVDIFFVLSGFLMAKLTDKISSLEFYIRRLKRLLPAYLVTIFFTTLAVFFITYPDAVNQHLDRLFFDLFALSNVSFWTESSYFDTITFKPLLNLWSLAVELQFYLIAPFLLPFLRKRKIIHFIIMFGSLAASLVILTISPKTSFFMLPTRIWEFLFGAFAAWFILSDKESNLQKYLRFLSIFTIVVVLAFYPLSPNSFNILTGHPGLAVLIVVAGTAILLVLRIDKIISIHSSIVKGLIKLGDYSYSIYLTHFPIIVLVNYRPFRGNILGFDTMWNLAVILILTFISSYILYNYVESLRYAKKIIILSLSVVFSCVVLGVYGSHINSLRFSEKELAIFNAAQDRGQQRCGKLFRILNPTSNICRLGKVNSKNRILLLGDSHADSLKTAFTNAMDNVNYSTYFHISFNPLMSERSNSKVIMDETLKNKVDSVVIHFSLGLFKNSDYVLQLISFLNLMKESNVRVFFIAPVPTYLDVSVPMELFSQIKDQNYLFPSITQSDYYLDNDSFFKFIKENNIDNSFIFYPHLVMCPVEECIYEENGSPYYFDSQHLTLTGARILNPLLNNLAQRLKN